MVIVLITTSVNLKWGTDQDNADDRVRHGRAPCGPDNGNSKLTADQVRIIKATPRVKGSRNALAKRFGVSGSVIGMIRQGRIWRSVITS